MDAGQVVRLSWAEGYYGSFDFYGVKETDGYGAASPDLVLAVGDDVGIGDYVPRRGGYEAGAKPFRGFDLHDAVLDLRDDFR